MAGFRYDALDSDRATAHSNFLVIGPTFQTYGGSFVVPTTPGTVTVAGLPWQPDCVFMFGINYSDSDWARWWCGAASSVSDQWSGSNHNEDLNFDSSAARQSYWSNDKIVACCTGTDTEFEGIFTGFTSDGFTINFTDATAHSLSCYYIAINKVTSGNIKVGTTLSSSGTGTQSISGLGFQPSALYILAGPGALGFQDQSWCSGGVADIIDNYSCCSGSRKGHSQKAVYYHSDSCISFSSPKFNSGTPPNTLHAQAQLYSMDTDGFTLNWTTHDGTPRYFHWIAFGGSAACGRYPHTDAVNVHVSTKKRPKGLLGVGNASTIDGFQSALSIAAGFGISFCAENSFYQRSASWDDVFPETLAISETYANLDNVFQRTFNPVVEDNDPANGVIVNLFYGQPPQIYRRPNE
jgi:hypothetical protein